MLALRRTTAVFLSLALAGAAAPTPATATVAPLWDHPGYDAEDSHHNPRETVINSGKIRQVVKKWQVKLRTSDKSCSGFSGPLLTAGRIHVSDQLGLSAYAADTGKILWRYDWADPSDSETPRLALSDGLVIAAGGDCNSQSDPDGHLLALDARTGLPRWKQRLGSPVNSVVVDKSVIVVSGGSASDTDVVAAYAVRDGRALWSRDNALTSEVSADGTILVRSTDGYGTATGTSSGVAVTDGRNRWTRRAGWTAQAADPSSGRFYPVDKTGALSAVRVADGSTAWTAAPSTAHLIAVDGNRIYRVAGKTVEALNVSNGKKAWSAQQAVEGSQPVSAGGLLYTGGPVLNPADGKPSGPAYTGRVIVTGGRIHQLDQGVLTTYAP